MFLLDAQVVPVGGSTACWLNVSGSGHIHIQIHDICTMYMYNIFIYIHIHIYIYVNIYIYICIGIRSWINNRWSPQPLVSLFGQFFRFSALKRSLSDPWELPPPQALLSSVWRMFPFPPLQLGLALLLEGRGRQITEADKAAVAHGFFQMLKSIAPKDGGWD